MAEIKTYKEKVLPSSPNPNSIYWIKASNNSDVTGYITDINGVPYPLKDLQGSGAGITSIVNTDGAIDIIGSSTIVVNLDSVLLATINSALQSGANISELVNDQGYITSASVITNHSGLTLDDGTNPHGTTKADVGLPLVPNLDTTSAVANSHTHSNKAILDLITEAFTTSLKSIYDATTSSLTNLLTTGVRLITSGEITTLSNTSGVNTGDETTATIQTKRPLKTIEGQSLEGVGDIDLNKVDYDNYYKYNLSAGLVNGGKLTVNGLDNSKFDIEEGHGLIMDMWTDINNPVEYRVTWLAQTSITITNIATTTVTHVYIDKNQNIVQLNTSPNSETKRDFIYLGQIGHTNFTNIGAIINRPDHLIGIDQQLRDLEEAIGIISNGNIIYSNGANLQINKSPGTLFLNGLNFDVNKKQPSIKEFPEQLVLSFRYRTQTGLGSTVSLIDPTVYDNGGVITSIIGNKYTNQYVYLTAGGNIVIQYGQFLYNSLNEALSKRDAENFATFINLIDNAYLLATISIGRNTTSLEDSSNCVITNFTRGGGSTGTMGISEAPIDGSTYGRKDGLWENLNLDSKLDKVTTVDVEKVYIKNSDGTQGVKPSTDFGGANTFIFEGYVNQNFAASTLYYTRYTYNSLLSTGTFSTAAITPANDFADHNIQSPSHLIPCDSKLKNITYRFGSNVTLGTPITMYLLYSNGNAVAKIANPKIIATKTFNTASSFNFETFTALEMNLTHSLLQKGDLRVIFFNNNNSSNMFSGTYAIELEKQ